MLGVTKPTLYAYVSRGIVGRSTAADGRTSLYPRDEIERLAGRARTRRDSTRATIDVEISSGITELQDEGVRYRGHDSAALARTHRFEQVAELLWSGKLPDAEVHWPLDRAALARCRTVIDAAQATDPIVRLTLAATTMSGTVPRDDDPNARSSDAARAARTLLALAPSLLGGPHSGDLAARLAAAYQRRPSPQLVEAISRALVSLADHELATSTLAVRVACSVRADPFAAIATGLSVVGGPLHGAASSVTVRLLREAADRGASPAVDGVLTAGRRLPGFGHMVYRNGDPRLAPMLEAVRALPDPGGRLDVVEQVLAAAGRRLGYLPNIDFGIGALAFVAGVPADASVFAVARIAGWAAHYDEECGERPVRFRGVTSSKQ
jgi:citrate synthase